MIRRTLNLLTLISFVFLGSCAQQGGDDHYQRGTRAQARLRACEGYAVVARNIDESFGAGLASAPDVVGPFVDCVLRAGDCDAVLECDFTGEFNFPKGDVNCDPITGSRCEGDRRILCTTDDDVSFYEVTFDCAAVGGSCVQGEDGDRSWSDCVVSPQLCKGAATRCEGARGVVCSENPILGITFVSEVDCADVFGAACVVEDSAAASRLYCEGPGLPEVSCRDGKDNDQDGSADCDDDDCGGACTK